jgi:hypothetical protein
LSAGKLRVGCQSETTGKRCKRMGTCLRASLTFKLVFCASVVAIAVVGEGGNALRERGGVEVREERVRFEWEKGETGCGGVGSACVHSADPLELAE